MISMSKVIMVAIVHGVFDVPPGSEAVTEAALLFGHVLDWCGHAHHTRLVAR